MKTLIIFREGHSGHYLQSLINNHPVDAKFRMDNWYPGIYNSLPEKISGDNVCLHHSPGVDYENKFDLILTILPDQKIYHAIYNIFFKKMLIEEFTIEQYQNWQNDPVFWYDKSYYHIKQYYELITQDITNNRYPNIVNFDRMLDKVYLDQIFHLYYGKGLTDIQTTLVEQYKNKQLNIDLPRTGKSMVEITDPIPDSQFVETPWFASYCIYKYEFNNGLTESQRRWSINDIKTIIDKTFLLSLETQYHY